MIGYHFTTWEAWQDIQRNGIQLSHLSSNSYPDCEEVSDLLDDGCIWVYTDLLPSYKMAGMVVYVALKHETHKVILLEVEYPEKASATILGAKQLQPGDRIRLTHTYNGAGPYGHSSQPFDLVLQPILPGKFDLLGEWDMLEFADNGIKDLIEA